MSESEFIPPSFQDFQGFWETLRHHLPLPEEPELATKIMHEDLPVLEAPLLKSLQSLLDDRYIYHTPKDICKYIDGHVIGGAGSRGCHQPYPLAVVIPENEQQIATLMVWAAERDFRLLPCGGGTSPFEHKVFDDRPFLLVSLEKMNAVLRLDTDNYRARVQAGSRWTDLDKVLAPHMLTTGQTFAFPKATVGGCLAAGDVGLKSLKYGTPHEYIMSMRTITPAGPFSIRQAHPGEPNMLSLVVGTYGSWGIITEVWLRLYTRPTESFYLSANFDSWDTAVTALHQIIKRGSQPTWARLVGKEEIQLFGPDIAATPARKALRLIKNQSLPVKARLTLGIEGDRDVVMLQKQQIDSLLREFNVRVESNPISNSQWNEGLSQRAALLQKLQDHRILVYFLRAAVPWHLVKDFCENWENTLRSVTQATSGTPGLPLTTLYAAHNYAMLHTLLIGRQATGDTNAVCKQLEAIQTVAWETLRRWDINTYPSPILTQVFGDLGMQLDATGVMFRYRGMI